MESGIARNPIAHFYLGVTCPRSLSSVFIFDCKLLSVIVLFGG
uniref:Uncharacterized protein n=1 Tax=Aeromonas hydrophila TaxID=644 RepID=A0A857JT71_AERHY|nr:Hypothetical protein [Aeromonas hydrophila]